MKRFARVLSFLMALLLLGAMIPSASAADDPLHLTLTEHGTFSVHTALQKAYLDSEDIWSVYGPDINARGIAELSRQAPVILKWNIEGDYPGFFDVRLYRDEALSEEVRYVTPERYPNEEIIEKDGIRYFAADGEIVKGTQLHYYRGYYYYTSSTGAISVTADRTIKEGYADIPKAKYHFDELGRLSNGPVGLCERAIYDLLPGKYYWTVSYELDGVTYTSDASSFRVACEEAYNYTVEGVTNVRDIGYWTTEDGGMVRPGMFFRTGELNECYETTPCITYPGVRVMRELFGIKTEIDLRADKEAVITESPLGADVAYYHINIPYFNPETASGVAPVLELLANPDNYPLICHCKVGTDRTGFVSIVVEALLGMSYDDIVREYLFSNYGNIGDFRDDTSIAASALPAIAAYEKGGTLAEKAYQFCLDVIGVPAETLDSIISILKLEPADLCQGLPAYGVEPLGHDLVPHEAKAPSCTEIGWDAYDTCSRCGYTTYKELPALDHDIIPHEAKDPSCTEIGWDEYDTCSRCDYTTYKELPALDHDIIHHEANAPSCTEIGWDAYDTCSRCDYTTYKELPITAHEYKAGACIRCGAKDPDYVPTNPFSDVKKKDWFYENVKFAYANGLFSGKTETTFAPNDPMTRGMLVTVLWRLDGKPEAKGANPFSDVKAKQYYAEPITWAAENNIVGGVGGDRFDPEGNVTREQIAKIMYGYAALKQYDTAKTADITAFPDYGKVSKWAREFLSWANAEGLITGTNKGGVAYLDPQGNATRAQVAAIMQRFAQAHIN